MTPRTANSKTMNQSRVDSSTNGKPSFFSDGSYQGTTSVVPYRFVYAGVLTPAVRAAIIYSAIFLLAFATVWAPIISAQKTDHAKKLGMKLMCMCGCAQVLVQCNHINCPSSAPMLAELDDHIARSEPDEIVVQDFIQEYGVAVLSSPPNTGFNRVAWLLPGVVFALGLGLVSWLVGRWRHNSLVTASAPHSPQISVSADALARAREKVDRETEE